MMHSQNNIKLWYNGVCYNVYDWETDANWWWNDRRFLIIRLLHLSHRHSTWVVG